ncbi:MAG: L,D-transpeptidase family protein [Lachnospiraceae bacterium]|nr:L,D-transpeptidase family protein [Lachnospiraceae bacterium]
MFFMKLWYRFTDKMHDKKFKTIFITSIATILVLAGVLAGIAFLVQKNRTTQTMSVDPTTAYSAEDESNTTEGTSEDAKNNASISINGIDVSGMSLQEVEDMLKDMSDKYSLSVMVGGQKVGTIEGKNIDFSYNDACNLKDYIEAQAETAAEEESKAKKKAKKNVSKSEEDESSFDLFTALSGTLGGQSEANDYTIDDLWKYDEEKLDAEIGNIVDALSVNEVIPEDMKLEYSDAAGFYYSSPQPGRYVNKDAVSSQIKDAVKGFSDDIDISENDAYTESTASAAGGNGKMEDAVNTLNSYMNSVLRYDFNGETKVLTRDKMHDWFYVDADYNVQVDQDAVQIYATKLADAYTEYTGTSQFLTSYGTYINIKTPAAQKVDVDALFSYLVQDIKSCTTVERSIPYTRTQAAGSNFGGTYAEIDLTGQHLFFYYQGQRIVDCPIVSGSVDKGYATPGGVFTVRYVKKNAILHGVDYETPVDYWMPFNGGIGMHDASWRDRFGGDIYITDGSHGCINMPHDAVEKVFQYAYKGMYVIVYGGSYDVAAAKAKARETAPAPVETQAPQPPTQAPQPPTEAPQPPTEETQPPTEAPQPPTEETQPPTEAPQPPTEETQPPVETEAPVEESGELQP